MFRQLIFKSSSLEVEGRLAYPRDLTGHVHDVDDVIN